MSTIYKITIERVTTERRVVKQWVKLYGVSHTVINQLVQKLHTQEEKNNAS